MEATAEVIIEKIDNDYANLLRLYHSMPSAYVVEPMLSDGWSVKDILAHIAAWEWRCASLLKEAHFTDVPLKASPAVEALNREFYEERKSWTLGEIEADFCRAHRTLLQEVRNLPLGRLNDPIVWENIARYTWQHYQEHLPELQHCHNQIVRGNLAETENTGSGKSSGYYY